MSGDVTKMGATQFYVLISSLGTMGRIWTDDSAPGFRIREGRKCPDRIYHTENKKEKRNG